MTTTPPGCPSARIRQEARRPPTGGMGGRWRNERQTQTPRGERVRMTDRTALIPADEARALVEEWLPDGVAITSTGLHFNQAALTFETWEAFGRDLEAVRREEEIRLKAQTARYQVILWCIADWLRYGEHRYGEKYAQAADLIGLSGSALANLNWLADKFQNSRRLEFPMTIWHHQEVAALPEDDADELLDEAQEQEWNTRQLRQAAEDRKAENDGKDPDVERARRALDLALDKMKALGPEHWAGVIVAALIQPLRHECAGVEYEAFVAHLWALTEEVLQG